MWEMWFIRFTYERNLFSLHNRLKQVFKNETTTVAYGRREQGLHQPTRLKDAKSGPMMTKWDEKYVNFNKKVNCYHVDGTLAWRK